MRRKLFIFSNLLILSFFSAVTVYTQTPGGISANLSLWYRADNLTVTGNNRVSAWANAAPAPLAGTDLTTLPNRTPVYNTGTNNPGSQINFNPSVSFTSGGANNSPMYADNVPMSATITGTGAGGAAPYATSYYIVYRQRSPGNYFLNHASASGSSNISIFNNNGTAGSMGFVAGRFSSEGPVTSGGEIRLLSFDGNSNTRRLYTNGVVQPGNGGGTLGTSASGTFTLGGNNGTTNATSPNIDIAEVVVYNNAVGTSRNQVETYLAIKYGVSLGTYSGKGTATAINYTASPAVGSGIVWQGTAAYQYNMAGIGRDDGSGLLQKQSQTNGFFIAGTNPKIIIGLNQIAVSNAANTGSFEANGNYLIWGDNANTTALQSSKVNGTTGNTVQTIDGVALTASCRTLQRVWRIQNTGVAQALQMFIPQAYISGTLSGCNKLVLLQNPATDIFTNNSALTTSNFTTVIATNTTTTTTVNGVTGYLVNCKFPTGTSFFTIGYMTEMASGAVHLPVTSTATIGTPPACSVTNGYQYYYLDGDPTKKIFAINWTGSTESSSGSTTTGIITYNAGGAPNSNTYGSATCNIMGRLVQITPPADAVIEATGVKVRIYYDPAEVASAKNMTGPPAADSGWFKHPGDAAATIKDNSGATLFNATYFIPVRGVEDGINYVEYDGVTSFSTFGFVTTNKTGSTLPVTLANFTAKAINCEAVISWSSAVENNFSHYEVQQSIDGNDFSAVQKIQGKGSNNHYTTQFPLTAKSEYIRLKMVDNNAAITYSGIVPVNSDCVNSQAPVLSPNPVTGKFTINHLGAGNKSIMINTVNGATVYKTSTTHSLVNINAANWAAGIYFVRIATEGKNITTIKIIKK